MQRSATSVISRSTETGCSTRTKSPAASIAPMKARRLSSAMMDRADAAGQELVAYSLESGVAQPAGEVGWFREFEHRLWQVAIRIPMFRHDTADGGKDPLEVEQVRRAQRGEARRRELEHHEPCPGPEHPGGFPEPRIQVREIPYPEGDHRAVEPPVGEREHERIGRDGTDPAGLALPPLEHRDHEVGADNRAAEARLACQRRGQVQRAGAEIEVDAVRIRLPGELPHGDPPPAAVHVEAEQM